MQRTEQEGKKARNLKTLLEGKDQLILQSLTQYLNNKYNNNIEGIPAHLAVFHRLLFKGWLDRPYDTNYLKLDKVIDKDILEIKENDINNINATIEMSLKLGGKPGEDGANILKEYGKSVSPLLTKNIENWDYSESTLRQIKETVESEKTQSEIAKQLNEFFVYYNENNPNAKLSGEEIKLVNNFMFRGVAFNGISQLSLATDQIENSLRKKLIKAVQTTMLNASDNENLSSQALKGVESLNIYPIVTSVHIIRGVEMNYRREKPDMKSIENAPLNSIYIYVINNGQDIDTHQFGYIMKTGRGQVKEGKLNYTEFGLTMVDVYDWTQHPPASDIEDPFFKKIIQNVNQSVDTLPFNITPFTHKEFNSQIELLLEPLYKKSNPYFHMMDDDQKIFLLLRMKDKLLAFSENKRSPEETKIIKNAIEENFNTRIEQINFETKYRDNEFKDDFSKLIQSYYATNSMEEKNNIFQEIVKNLSSPKTYVQMKQSIDTYLTDDLHVLRKKLTDVYKSNYENMLIAARTEFSHLLDKYEEAKKEFPDFYDYQKVNKNDNQTDRVLGTWLSREAMAKLLMSEKGIQGLTFPKKMFPLLEQMNAMAKEIHLLMDKPIDKEDNLAFYRNRTIAAHTSLTRPKTDIKGKITTNLDIIMKGDHSRPAHIFETIINTVRTKLRLAREYIRQQTNDEAKENREHVQLWHHQPKKEHALSKTVKEIAQNLNITTKHEKH